MCTETSTACCYLGNSQVTATCCCTPQIYSRFKPLRTVREDTMITTCAAFLNSSDLVLLGAHSGELLVRDVPDCEVVDVYEGHDMPLTSLQVGCMWGPSGVSIYTCG